MKLNDIANTIVNPRAIKYIEPRPGTIEVEFDNFEDYLRSGDMDPDFDCRAPQFTIKYLDGAERFYLYKTNSDMELALAALTEALI